MRMHLYKRECIVTGVYPMSEDVGSSTSNSPPRRPKARKVGEQLPIEGTQ